MSVLYWPVSLPQLPQTRAFSGGPQDDRVSFKPERGLAILRPNSTGVVQEFSLLFRQLSQAQLEALEAFILTDLAYGTARFALRMPPAGDVYEWQIVGQGRRLYQVQALDNGNWDVTLQMARAPGARWYSPYAPPGFAAVPSLVLDFEAETYGVEGAITPVGDLLSVVRSGATATYFDSAGVMQTAPANSLRLDHDPLTGAARGLLVEDVSTNELTRSAAFDNAAWTKTNATVTANGRAAPDGATAMDKIVEDVTTASSHSVHDEATLDLSNKLTFSVFVGRAERNHVTLRLWAIDGSNDRHDATFDLSGEGVLESLTKTAGAGDDGEATITRVSDSPLTWRITLSGTPNATGASGTARGAVYLNDGSGLLYDGDGSSGLFVWGAQLEDKPFPTSHIPTDGAAVTRNADDVSLSLGAYFSDTAGSVLAHCRPGTDVENGWGWALTDGTVNNRIALYANAASELEAEIWAGGVSQLTTVDAVVSVGALSKAAFAWQADDAALSVNGGASETDASVTLPGGLDTLEIGHRVGTGVALNGHIARLSYWPARLPEAVLRALTA